MNVIAYPLINEEGIIRNCNKKCGIITSTEDQQYFALACLSCSGKFLYFDAFIEHMQTTHINFQNPQDMCNSVTSLNVTTSNMKSDKENREISKIINEIENFNDAHAALLHPQLVMVKQENIEEESNDERLVQNEMIVPHNDDGLNDMLYAVKQEQTEGEFNLDMNLDSNCMIDSHGSCGNNLIVELAGNDPNIIDDNNTNYDDLVEESLLEDSTMFGVTSHIKDRKMIQFLIDAYRRNIFLWDHHHPQFRDRNKRSRFADWINDEFKRKFNVILTKDAVARKWDNLRTVYKRECNRMILEKTNISTLWYFRELHFLNRLYGRNHKLSEAIVQEAAYRKRQPVLWNDMTTLKLLSLIKSNPCFYDKHHIDYRSKEKRSEALQRISVDLQKLVDVTAIQISKRISQLRFDYSKQKQERLLCEMSGRPFSPSYIYYEAMLFMDADVAPYKCEKCTIVKNSLREIENHMLMHQQEAAATAGDVIVSSSGGSSKYYCAHCHLGYSDVELFNEHMRIHLQPSLTGKAKYRCDLCSAAFRDKMNYNQHMRRHNDELLIPDLNAVLPDNNSETIKNDHMNPFGFHQEVESNFKCDYLHCGRTFISRSILLEHIKQHYKNEEFKCEICGKLFKSLKNLHNHKQIHDAIKKYVCKLCGSAFAQAAGLYLHKRRHNRQNERSRLSYQIN